MPRISSKAMVSRDRGGVTVKDRRAHLPVVTDTFSSPEANFFLRSVNLGDNGGWHDRR